MAVEMVDMTYVNKVVDALEALGIDNIQILPTTALREELEVDSTEIVEIVALIAGVAPDGKALEGIRTVGELVTFVSAA